jgi:hypothetical protein
MDGMPWRIAQRHPMRKPDWGWTRASHIAEAGRRAARDDGPEVRTAAALLRRERHGRRKRGSASRVTDARIGAARDLAGSDGLLRALVEARILAGQCDEDVARSCGIDGAVVALFESLFFRVRDRLSARDWVVAQAIRATPAAGFRDLGRLWRAVGYFGGPDALDVLVMATAPESLAGARDAVLPRCLSPRSLESARLLAACLLSPDDTGLRHAASLHALVKRVEAVRRPVTVAETVARRADALLAEVLDSVPGRAAAPVQETCVA